MEGRVKMHQNDYGRLIVVLRQWATEIIQEADKDNDSIVVPRESLK